MESKKREEIINNMVELSKVVDAELNNENQRRENITYCPKMVFGDSRLEERNVYIVEISNKNDEKTANKTSEKQGNEIVDNIDGVERYTTYEIYDENKNLIATVDEAGKIEFSEEYLESLREISKGALNSLELEDLDFELPEDAKENGLSISKEELEERTNENKINEISNEIGSEEINSYSEMEANQELLFDNITSKQEMDADIRVTQTESLSDIIPEVKEKGFVKIGVVYSDKVEGKNGRFCFIGITADGKIGTIDSLENTEGTTTGQKITSLNSRDGELVEQEQVAGMARINGRNTGNGTEEYLSVKVGQYGILEVDYVRRELEMSKEDAYISAPIETQNQRPTTREVREFMDKSKNPDMSEELQKSSPEIERDGETKMQNMDDSASNDYVGPDDIIVLEDGSTTTLREQAEKAKVSPEEFTRRYNEGTENTPDEIIDNIHDEIEEEYGAPTRNRY